jgi:hypothetical protein
MRRRFFQFRLRSVFVIVAIAAVPCTLLAWKMERKRQERAVVAAILTLGGKVYYEYEKGPPPHEPPGPIWLRKLFGDDFFAEVDSVEYGNSAITDAALDPIREFKHIKYLDLSRTDVTDEGLRRLKSLSNLQLLILEQTAVTGDGLIHLKGLVNLEYLDLTDTKVTSSGLAALQEALPNCQILSSPVTTIYEIRNYLDTRPESEEPESEEPEPEEPESEEPEPEEREASRMPRIRHGLA